MENMEIDYNSDYAQALDELEWLRSHTLLFPIAALEVNKLRRSGKEREANALEYEQRFNFFMKLRNKEWHYRDPHGEQSLREFSHDELGRFMFAAKEQGKGR